MRNTHAFTATYEILYFDRDGNPVEKIVETFAQAMASPLTMPVVVLGLSVVDATKL